MNSTSLAIDVSVTGDGSDAIAVRCTARNISPTTVYLFDSPRMPYLLDEQGTLVVLHGIHPLPEDRDLNAIEIPTTRALTAGETITFTVALAPLRLHDHYGDEPPAPARHGPTTLVCRVGHGATPIDASARARTSIQTLLHWQRLETSQPISLRLP